VDGTYGDEFRPWELARACQESDGGDLRMIVIALTYVVETLDLRGNQRMNLG
jgi:hypothetical protein